MPLYLDLHQFDEISMEDLKRNHMADLTVQDKHSVRILQFWLNKEGGAAYCLYDAPNPEACEACHREAHGDVFCNIQKVEPGFFNLFMGEGLPVEEDMTMSRDGNIDTGDRALVVLDFTGLKQKNKRQSISHLQNPGKPKDLVMNAFGKFDGRIYQNPEDDNLVGIFEVSLNAVRCAVHIRNELLRLAQSYGEKSEWNINFRIGVNKGMPLTRYEGFFEEALKYAKRLSLIAKPYQIALSGNLKSYYHEMEFQVPGASANFSHLLAKDEEEFIDQLFEIIDRNLSSSNLSVNQLSAALGLSRPQVYRKINALTGKSPNDFIKYVRLNKALAMLKSKEGNIAEIAMKVGYTNPSYFTKIFTGYFGYMPSTFYFQNKS